MQNSSLPLNPDLLECKTLAKKICRRKSCASAFIGVEYDAYKNPCARRISLIRGNEFLTTLSELRLLANRRVAKNYRPL